MSEPLIPGGYILLSRKIIDSKIWDKPPLYLKVWVYLLARAQHADYKGLKRGQLRTSIPDIIEACSWKSGYRTERPTKDQVFQILEWLRSESGGGNGSNNGSNNAQMMITTTKATQGMLVNIENYCFYQEFKNYGSNNETNNGTATEATTDGMREQRQPDNINNNVNTQKNGNEGNKNNRVSNSPAEKPTGGAERKTRKGTEYTDEFETFWSMYPRRKEKQNAYKSWNTRLKEGADPDDLVQAAGNYAIYCQNNATEERFIKHAATFLGPNKPYEDYVRYVPTASDLPIKKEPKSFQALRNFAEKHGGGPN